MLKRLIEVALPVKEVSEQSAWEKSIRHWAYLHAAHLVGAKAVRGIPGSGVRLTHRLPRHPRKGKAAKRFVGIEVKRDKGDTEIFGQVCRYRR